MTTITPYRIITDASLVGYLPLNTDFKNYRTSGATGGSLTTINQRISIENATPNIFGGYARFGRDASGGILIEPSLNVLSTNGITIAFWLKVDDVSITSGAQRFFEHQNASNSPLFFSIYRNSADLNGIHFNVASITTNGAIFRGYKFDTNWHHYCFTITSTPTTATWTLYVDGSNCGNPTSVLNPSTISNPSYPATLSNIPTTIGGRFSYSEAPKNVSIAQYFIFNRIITQSEISDLFNVYSFPFPCFLQGSKILHYDPVSNEESYVPVETLRKGDLVRTFMSGYKPVSHIGWKTLENPATSQDIRDRLYGISAKQANPDAEFDEPLYLTGRHSILQNDLTEYDLDLLRKCMGDVFVTENHYRVPIFMDSRAKPYTDNTPVTIWHFSLEHPDKKQNYGVYANGILVESSSAEYMTDHSNMELLD